jgi:Flp pilus assembly protein TadD
VLQCTGSQPCSDQVKQGNALDDQCKYDEALTAFDEATQIDPNVIHAWKSKGVTFEALGRTTEANAANAKELEDEG